MWREEGIIQALLTAKRLDWDCKCTKREGHCNRCGRYFDRTEKRTRVYTCDDRGKYNNDNNVRVLFCKECFEWFFHIYLHDKYGAINEKESEV